MTSWYVKGPFFFLLSVLFIPLSFYRWIRDWFNYFMLIVYDYSARDEPWEYSFAALATFFCCFTAWCIYEDATKRKPKKEKEPWQD
mmetsp:Transcript_15099/g.35421  ORF Transcript_15099/g.35421 Transcript_15099/m.35421 type:complete len:86 (+) Transcript_15099:81-338(+)